MSTSDQTFSTHTGSHVLDAQVEDINKTVDIPLLSEEQEAVVIDRCLCTISDALLRILPPAWLSVLQGSSSVEIQQLEELAVLRAEKLIPDVPVRVGLDCVTTTLHGVVPTSPNIAFVARSISIAIVIQTKAMPVHRESPNVSTR